MKILLVSLYFPPDVGSAAHLFYELGSALVDRGHEVTVLTSLPNYHAQGPLDEYRGRIWLREVQKGMGVIRLAVPQFARGSMVGRALWQFSGAAAFLSAGMGMARHDAGIVYSPPLPLGVSMWALHRLRGMPYILNVQDLFPQSIIDLGLLQNPRLIRLFEAMERFVYRRAPAITVHSEGNRQHVIQKGASPARVTAIPNWVDTDFIAPSMRMNGFRVEHDLGDAFVVSFAGVLGYSQDLDIILDAAHILRDRSDIVWLVVGDGVTRPAMEQRAEREGLSNVRFLDMQPRDKYPDVLHASDVGLVTLRADVLTPVVPSKILSIMASGRPVVAAMRPEGDAPKLILESESGLCVAPEDAPGLAQAVMRLYNNPRLREQMAANGRRYAETSLSLTASAERYETLLRQVVV